MPKGRKGAEQRVKGNVKVRKRYLSKLTFHSLTHTLTYSLTQSASSGRMSELLGSEGVGFIGFDQVSSGFHGNTTDGGEDILMVGTGSNFTVVMKQLGKRDPTTKLKVSILTNS